MIFFIMRQVRVACGLCFMAVCASAQAVSIADNFDRADSTILGATSTGGVKWFESGDANLVASAEETADLFNGELEVFGFQGFFGSGNGVANLNANLADVNISATMRFGGLFRGSNNQNYNGGGFVLRRNGEEDANPSRSDGLVEIDLFPSGGLFVRETHAGALNTLYRGTAFGGTDPNPFGLGGSNNPTYSAAGQLPTTFNGLPFDANGNGVLEDNEPFQFGANLVGNSLDVLVNGQSILTKTLSRSAPVSAQSTVGLLKNRFISQSAANDAISDRANPTFDNLVITGTPYTVPVIKHVGDANPFNEVWLAAGGAPPVTQGAVNDGGTLAWNINDSSAGANTLASWQSTPTQDQLAAIATGGWRMKGTVKVLGTSDAIDAGVELSVFASSKIGYLLELGSDAAGNALVAPFAGTLAGGYTFRTPVTVNGSGYHTYEMVFNPTTSTVDVFADNVLIISNMASFDRGTSSALNRVLWGANSSTGMGNANYSSIQFIAGAPPTVLAGDYNNNGVVDAADYVVWRKSQNTTATLANDPIGGTIGAAHYTQWRSNFGNTLTGAGSGHLLSASVPEPTSMGLLLLSVACLTIGLPGTARKR